MRTEYKYIAHDKIVTNFVNAGWVAETAYWEINKPEIKNIIFEYDKELETSAAKNLYQKLTDIDVMHGFNENWKELVCNEDGTLNLQAVANELSDFKFMLEQVPKVYMHVTNGILSKTNYFAKSVIDCAERCFDHRLEEEKSLVHPEYDFKKGDKVFWPENSPHNFAIIDYNDDLCAWVLKYYTDKHFTTPINDDEGPTFDYLGLVVELSELNLVSDHLEYL